jgi:hypothetical protein
MRSLALFLLSPLPVAESLTGSPGVPALKRILSRASLTRYEEQTPETLLLQMFGVNRQRDWPVAPFAYRGEGRSPGDRYWLCADPVHLRLERDALLLADARYFSLDAADAQSLVHSLNAHFVSTGMSFFAASAKRWYATAPGIPRLETTPLALARGRSVDPHLPRGEDALDWHRAFNEIQMLMHSHPVNEAREAAGEPAVNSVWFWGGGTLQPSIQSRYAHVWSSEPLSRGLAAAAGITATPLPESFAEWLDRARDGDHLVAASEPQGHVDVLASLEQTYFVPLLRAVAKRTISVAQIVFAVGSVSFHASLTARDLWRFWRNRIPELSQA